MYRWTIRQYVTGIKIIDRFAFAPIGTGEAPTFNEALSDANARLREIVAEKGKFKVSVSVEGSDAR